VNYNLIRFNWHQIGIIYCIGENMKIKDKVLLLVLLPLSIISILTIISLFFFNHYFVSNVKLDNDKFRAALEIELNREKMAENFDKYIILKDKTYLNEYNKYSEQVNKELYNYKSLDLDKNEEQYITEVSSFFSRILRKNNLIIDINEKQDNALRQIVYLLDNQSLPLLQKSLSNNIQDKSRSSKEFYFHKLAYKIEKVVSNIETYSYTHKLDQDAVISNNLNELENLISSINKYNLTKDESINLSIINKNIANVKLQYANFLTFEEEENTLVSKAAELSDKINYILSNTLKTSAVEDLNNSQNDLAKLSFSIIGMLSIIFAASIILGWMLSSKYIAAPVNRLKKIADRLSKGELGKEVTLSTKDEFSDLATSFNRIIKTKKGLVLSAEELGKGNFDVVIEPRSENDILGHALLNMRNNLKNLNSENEKQLWVKTKITSLSQKIQGIKKIDDLLLKFVSEMSNILNIQYAGFYLLENYEEGIQKLNLKASYAYQERKGLSSSFKLGEGIVGQCASEKKAITITDIPDDYIRVVSGLGHEKPKIIRVSPIIFENKLIGVYEIASFDFLCDEKHTVLNEACNNLGIIIDSVQAHQRTTELLRKSQLMAEELKAQQEALEKNNKDLAENAQYLNESREELKSQSEELRAQSEELQFINQELEEKTERLEKQNKDIDTQNKEIEKARQELEQRAKDLMLASKYKSEFLANMSHELRTPLNSLLILAKNLSQNKIGNLSEKQIESANIIYQGGQDLLRLINDILDLSKVEAGKLHIEIEEVNFKKLATEIKTQFLPLLNQENLDFNIEIADNLPDGIKTDGQRLSQIIKNLLSNAIKFTKQGSISLKIDKESTSQNGIRFSVIDTGIGIPENKHKEIFGAFQQADGSTSRKYGGTGLGLAISKAMAELLGAEIKVTSELGKGSCFSLIFKSPLVTEQVGKEDTKIQLIENDSQIIIDDRESINMYSKTILIIEDDPKFAKILMDISRSKGFDCIVASTGNQALDLANKHIPKAILLDLGLPDMDGSNVLKEIRANIKTRHIPIHIISGRQKTENDMESSVIGFLEKPASEESINEAFNKIENLMVNKIKNLLVIEDDKGNQLAIRELLAGTNIWVDEALNIEEAYDKLKIDNNYDSIILDLTLPDGMGIELLKKLKSSGKKIPPVIVYTSKDLSHTEYEELQYYTSSIVLKGENSSERLLDEASLFLHKINNSDDLDSNITVVDKEHPPKNIKSQTSDKKDEVQSHKVLLVDDDMRNVFALSSVLEEYGFDVVIATNGEIALNKLQSQKNIELVIMDIMMPVMDGYEAIGHIRSNEDLKKIPVIALTAKAMSGDKEKCIEAGASDYISKPVDVERLISIMQVWL